MQNSERQDAYSRITAQIIADLERGVRPWVKPWNAEHSAGRITRPLRHNGQPYAGINVLSLWISAVAQNFAAPIWMTYRQASELGAHVRKGQKGSLVVYANKITRTEHDEKTGEDIEREIPYMKGYTVFNVEQIAIAVGRTQGPKATGVRRPFVFHDHFSFTLLDSNGTKVVGTSKQAAHIFALLQTSRQAFVFVAAHYFIAPTKPETAEALHAVDARTSVLHNSKARLS